MYSLVLILILKGGVIHSEVLDYNLTKLDCLELLSELHTDQAYCELTVNF